MRTFFITDIHGDLEGLNLLLDKAEVVPDRDQLVFGGDMINRGKDSAGVVRRIKQLTEQYPHNVHAVMGNHEEMMADYLVRGDKLWLSHGGHETLKSFAAAFPDEAVRQEQMVWACSLPLYYENDRYIFTHAGLNPAQPLDKQERDILWMNEYDFYHQPGGELLALTGGKPVIHGHTPVERIYWDGVRMNCDLGSNTYSVLDERSLGLVNLTEMTYLVYKQTGKKLEERRIGRY
ncbi:metallophosphoesterase family protein [Paenibacillus sp. FSL R7-0331]|uniref:metallophosphoesterase family protein n=1 Tax=Paenibacillus sp. FSL R7-0331 TaxID=1536773 RepID=UPI0004F64283|nr:metallophosphoesterase family protein [Paenibacillus sp. FSL R7-0331]AIQ54742.1 metallophosphoesterase [Paenibacillus sp. FSL R7-0331]